MVPYDLNEQIRFTSPGTYRVVIVSRHVRPAASEEEPEDDPMLRSNTMKLTIVSATPEWQTATLQQALDVLNKPSDHGPGPSFDPGDPLWGLPQQQRQ